MGINRLGIAQAALQIQLARGRYQQILTAHNMADALLGIVYHHRELICSKTIGAQQYKITDVACQIVLITADDAVVETDDFIRHP